MKTLILGARGQLGASLLTMIPANTEVLALDSTQLDIRDVAALSRAVAAFNPALVINATAYTLVDKAESEPAQAFAVNRDGIANLVQATPASTRLIHISTDFVFDGSGTRPYLPEDPLAPLGVYGQSKLAGEQVLRAQAAARSCIIRTAWLYAAAGKNFVNTMLALMATRDELSIVDDQRGTPTSAFSLARAVWRAAQLPALAGTLHWTDAGVATWYDFACEIQRQALQLGLLSRKIPLRPIPTSAYPTPAQRPAYSVLDKTASWQALAMVARPWQEELADVLHIKWGQQVAAESDLSPNTPAQI
jgi:dTDP-4-dehydrorhamnose reductase